MVGPAEWVFCFRGILHLLNSKTPKAGSNTLEYFRADTCTRTLGVLLFYVPKDIKKPRVVWAFLMCSFFKKSQEKIGDADNFPGFRIVWKSLKTSSGDKVKRLDVEKVVLQIAQKKTR